MRWNIIHLWGWVSAGKERKGRGSQRKGYAQHKPARTCHRCACTVGRRAFPPDDSASVRLLSQVLVARLGCPWVASECDAVIAWLPCGHEAPCLSFLRGMPGTLTTRKLRLCSGGGSRGGAELRRGDRSYAYGRAVPLWTPVSCSIISIATVCFAYIVCCTRTVRSDLRICDGMMTHQVGSSPSLEQ